MYCTLFRHSRTQSHPFVYFHLRQSLGQEKQGKKSRKKKTKVGNAHRRDTPLPVGIGVDETDAGRGHREHGRDEVDGDPDAPTEHDHAVASVAVVGAALATAAGQPGDGRERRQADHARTEAAVHRYVPAAGKIFFY